MPEIRAKTRKKRGNFQRRLTGQTYDVLTEAQKGSSDKNLITKPYCMQLKTECFYLT